MILKSNEQLENKSLVLSLCEDFLIKYPTSDYNAEVLSVKRNILKENGIKVNLKYEKILAEINSVSNQILKIKNSIVNLDPLAQIEFEKFVTLRIDFNKSLFQISNKQLEKDEVINKVFQDYELLINSYKNDDKKILSIISELRSTAKELKILDKQIFTNSNQYKLAEDLFSDLSEVIQYESISTKDKRSILYLFLKKFPESSFKNQVVKRIAEYSTSLHDNLEAAKYYKFLFELTPNSEINELRNLDFTVSRIFLDEKKYNEIEEFSTSIDKKIPNYYGAKPIYIIAKRMEESFKDTVGAIHFYKRIITSNKTDTSLVKYSLIKLIKKYKNALPKAELFEYLELSKSYFKNKEDLIYVFNELIEIYFKEKKYTQFHDSVKEMNNRVSIINNKNIEKYLSVFCSSDSIINYKKIILFITELKNNDRALNKLISESELNYIEILINEGKNEEAFNRLLPQYPNILGNSNPNIQRSKITKQLGYLLLADLAVKTERKDEGIEMYKFVLYSSDFSKPNKLKANESLKKLLQ